MGVFKKVKPKVLDISGAQLKTILEHAMELTREDINTKCYTVGPEIMVEYKGKLHYAGIRYEKKKAKAEKLQTFCPAFASVYLDKQVFPTVTAFYEQAVMGKDPVKDIQSGLIVSTDYSSIIA